MTKNEALELRNRFPHFPQSAVPYAYHPATGDVCYLNDMALGYEAQPIQEMVSCNVEGACYVSEPASVVIPHITAREGWVRF